MTYLVASSQALVVWQAIQGDPTSIQLVRQGAITDDAPLAGPTTLPAQTVRVSRDNRPREVRGESGAGTQNHCILYGVRDHPDPAITDTDIQRGDTFVLDGDHYIVDYLNLVPGGVQAVCVLQAIGA